MALSFAGAQRDYVEQVAAALQAQGVRCFYDADEQIELWGKYLAEELPAIYGEQAAAVVVFVSAEYAARDWTRLERRAALDRAVRERREYVLPARFRRHASARAVVGHGRGRPARPDPAAVRRHDRRQAGRPRHRRVGRRPMRAGSAQDVEAARPAGAVRVGEADPRRLGVHAAISVPGVPDEVPPEYVPRDADAAEFGVRAKVAAAAERGGFVLLVGGSSVGQDPVRGRGGARRCCRTGGWCIRPGRTEVAALARRAGAADGGVAG